MIDIDSLNWVRHDQVPAEKRPAQVIDCAGRLIDRVRAVAEGEGGIHVLVLHPAGNSLVLGGTVADEWMQGTRDLVEFYAFVPGGSVRYGGRARGSVHRC